MALEGPVGLRSATSRPRGAADQLSPLRSQLPLVRSPQAAHRSPSEIQPEVAEENTPPPQGSAHRPGQRPRQTLADLFRRDSAEVNAPKREEKAQGRKPPSLPTLAELFRQETAEQAEQAEQARRAELARLMRSALPDGGAAMKRLKERAVRKHPRTAAQIWQAVQTGMPKTMKDQRRRDFEALVRTDLKALAETGQITPMSAVETMSEAVSKGLFGQGILKRDRALLLDVLGELSIDGIYQRLKLKQTPDTLAAYTDADVLEPPKRFGTGSFSTVYAVKVSEPDGSERDVLFKPIPQEEHWSFAGWKTGIPKDNPQTAMRNIATLAYAKKLGFDVIVDTRVALINVGKDPFEPALGLVMEPAKGKSAELADGGVFARADVCAEITKLQLLDHLTGEGDRHGLNYFIHLDPDDRPRIMGIDNEECFGEKLTDPAGTQKLDNDESRLFQGVGLPAVIDTEMESAIHAMSQEDIRSLLSDKLNDAEISAALQRYQGLKEHIAQLREAGHVIEPERWGAPEVQQLLTPENSYFARDRH